MVDINRHRFLLVQILKDIYADLELANCLGFKGGTALMFFYDLPRFSVDLDSTCLMFKRRILLTEKFARYFPDTVKYLMRQKCSMVH
jgi:predicted nucleotidyltransferase component of viral defense system